MSEEAKQPRDLLDRRKSEEPPPGGMERRLSLTDRRRDNNIALVTFRISSDWYAIPIHKIQEVILPLKITKIPTAPVEIKGLLNLRSQVLTVFDMRFILGYRAWQNEEAHINIVVHSSEGNVCLMVDEQGDYLEISKSFFQPVPGTIDKNLAAKLESVCYLPNKNLLMILDVEKIIDAQIQN